ncbi:MAG: metalloregulator ArsR/SmtB family transcription factor [Pelobacteraceae bacterium]
MIAVEQTQFTSTNDRIADALTIKSLGHPIRLKILVMLDMNTCNVKHLWECLGMKQAAVSQHLSVLKKCGIIDSNRKGAELIYTIVNPLAQKIVATLPRD